MDRGALIERERELDALERFWSTAGGLLVVAGPAGIGKTALLRRLEERAERDCACVLRGRALEFDRDVALGVARRLLGRPRDGIDALIGSVEQRAGAGRVLLAVDDGHWTDAASLRWLLELVRRPAAVHVAVAVDSEEPAAGVEALREVAATVLQPQPLSPRGVAVVVGPKADARRVIGLTAGNPLLVSALAADPEGVPEAVRRRTVVRLSRAGPAAQRLAEAVAVCEEVPLAQAAAVAGLQVGESQDVRAALVASGLLAPGEPLRYLQPLIGAAVAETLAPFARARLHRRAADALLGAEAVAEHLLRTRAAGDATAVARLSKAAECALAAGDPASAAALLRRADEEPPPPQERGRVRLALARADVMCGDVAAVDRFAAALRTLTDADDREEAWHELSWLLWLRGDFATAAAVARRGREDIGAHAERLLADELGAAGSVPELAAAAAEETMRLIMAVAEGRPPRDPTLLAHVVGHMGWRGLHLERVPELARMATAAEPLIDPRARGVPATFVAAALSWVDQVEASAALLDQAIERAIGVGDPAAAADLRIARAWQHYFTGELADAVRLLEQVVQERLALQISPALTALPLAVARLELDDVPGAQATIATGDPQSPGFGWGKGRVELHAGDAETALATLTEEGDRLERYLGLDNPAIVPWRSEAAIAAHRLGDREWARALAAAELARARELPGLRAVGVALRAGGIVAGGAEGLALLTEAVEVLERSQTRIELLRALVDLGAAERRAGRRATARRTLERACLLGERFGAVALRRRAHTELELMNTRAHHHTLTPAERRVAELAAGGRSTPAIARELHVSPRTIESQLASVYRKLGVASRHELAASLG